MATPHDILKQHWGYDQFRPLQEDIINAVLQGNDVLALLPTGGGKSLCFQVPALVADGLCLVISPLIALMKDQVEGLKKRGVEALLISSGMSQREVKETLQNAAYGAFKFLYVSPERLETNLFREYLPALNLNLIAVDEAHCISQWGYDFRPPYLRIAALRTEFPRVPVLALTASATPEVQQDICDKLQFASKNIFRQSFEKPNLSFSAFDCESRINKLLEVLQKVPGTAIVYCRNRKKTKEIAKLLQLHKMPADYYHAGLLPHERSQRQEDWINNKTRVIVCTNAFGMGIDKPDVRTVVHIDIPDNLENYYQEAGRAGRDGKRSYAVLLYNFSDLDDLRASPEVKYPPVKVIKEVYQQIANYLQLPVGSGEGMYFDFNLAEFIGRFKQNAFVVVNVLRALEQDGHLSFNEQVFMPAKVGFTCNKEQLEAFEQAHPELELLIKTLLRLYLGVFDNEVPVQLQTIANISKLTKEQVHEQLLRLQAFGMVAYQQLKETPQLFFAAGRAPAEHLAFNTEDYLKRKSQYIKRVAVMQAFVTLQEACRSQFIGKYFGDSNMKPCGICDNCLRKKQTQMQEEEFKVIAADVFQCITGEGIAIEQLLQHLKRYNKDKIWKVIDHLQGEGKLWLNENAKLVRK